MLTLFKNKEWIDETLSVISGNAADLHVTIYEFPCRKEKHGDRCHYRYRNFGNDFINELSERQLSDYTAVASTLTEGRSVRVPVKVGGLPEIIVEIQGHASPRKNEFYSDLADAIIDAFNKNGIKP
jgi:hypothetical protein